MLVRIEFPNLKTVRSIHDPQVSSSWGPMKNVNDILDENFNSQILLVRKKQESLYVFRCEQCSMRKDGFSGWNSSVGRFPLSQWSPMLLSGGTDQPCGTACPKKWLIECWLNQTARAKPPVAGTPCSWNFFWSFPTKTKQDQALLCHVPGKIWPPQFWLGFFYKSIYLGHPV